jgi:3-methylfumaryl-CoA hydratase
MTTLDMGALREWLGRKETAIDYVAVPTVHRGSAMLDRDDPFPEIGDPLPPGWHALLFPRVVRHSEVGADGHPKRGDFLPPVPLPRRMFAGKRVNFIHDLQVGDKVEKVSTIKALQEKTGRTGQMVFLTVLHEMIGPRGLALTEEQDIVYRHAPDPAAPPPPPQAAPAEAVWKRTIVPDPVLLFRFSALTFNGHRIHYDLPYVTGVEGYPGLIVNGGLTTLLLFELARTSNASPVVRFESRNVRPLFVGQPLHLCGAPSADGRSAKLWATNAEGALALTAEAWFA